MTTENFSFGYWVRRRRRARDMTQAELARQANCSLSLLRKIEADERRPSLQLVNLLADIFVLDPDEREMLLRVARAEQGPDQLVIATQPTATLEPAPLPSGTVSFLFSDIEGSSQHWQTHPAALRSALPRHDALLRAAVVSHGGQVFKTVGDAICAVFADPGEALAAALAGQRAIGAEPWQDHVDGRGRVPATDRPRFALRVRMALHTGTAELRDGDYFGLALTRVARLVAAGHGGQVLLSEATAALLRDHLPPDVSLRDIGAYRLKSFARPEQIYQLCASGLPAAFPPLMIHAQRATNLPRPASAFIGRQRELAALTQLLTQPAVRLITLTGPGGTGKTRLALQAGAALLTSDSWLLSGSQAAEPVAAERFPDGVWFIDLAPIRDPALVDETIAKAFDLHPYGDQSLRKRLGDYLREKRLLLLLDNVEQVIDAAPLIAELLAAPGLTILATSRIPLHLSGEREFAVPPLALPEHDLPATAASLGQVEALQLFVEHARACNAGFALSDTNAPAVAEICRRLDGLPLAIQLAAAWIRLFPPQALLARLNDRLQLLTGGARDLPARQQTLRDTLDWSYNLLSPDEQVLFTRLGVFAGGCTLEAAEAVCTSDGAVSSSVMSGIAALVAKSLLRQAEGTSDTPRLVMLETIREYARERLELSGDAEALRQAHAAYYRALAGTAQPHFSREEQRAWVQRIAQEEANLRGALAWHETSGDRAVIELRFAGALILFWSMQGLPIGPALLGIEHMRDPSAPKHRLLYETILAHYQECGDAWRSAIMQHWLGLMAEVHDDVAQAVVCYEASRAGCQQAGDQLGALHATFLAIRVQVETLGWHVMLDRMTEVLGQYRQLGDAEGCAWVLVNLGEVRRFLGEYARARAAYSESLALYQGLGDHSGSQIVHINLGYLAYNQGDLTLADAHFRDGLVLARETADPLDIAAGLVGLGLVAMAHQQAERATRLLGASQASFAAWGKLMGADDRAAFDGAVISARAALSDATFAAAWSAGQALTLTQAAAYALLPSDGR